MVASGELRVLEPDTALVARAREYLRRHGGAVESVQLVSHVCQLSGVPLAIADHLAATLFASTRDFVRDSVGRWLLVESAAPSAVRERPPLRLRDLSYVVVDVETTGTRPFAGDRITEIAAVHVNRGQIGEVYETLVNPERRIPQFITALTRITWSMVKDAPRFRDIAPRVSQALAGRLFVAHNAGFDWRFVSTELARASGATLFGERLCTVRLARAFLPQVRRRSLDSLAHYFGVEIAARHRAAGDAVATAHVLLRLLTEAESRGCLTLEDVRLATKPMGRSRRRRRRGRPHWSDGDVRA